MQNHIDFQKHSSIAHYYLEGMLTHTKHYIDFKKHSSIAHYYLEGLLTHTKHYN
jgi:antitoxin component YwqK of YwqJK toxin-antitoxin module